MAQSQHGKSLWHPYGGGSLSPTVPERMKADALDSQGPASKGEVGGPVSLSKPCDAWEQRAMLWKSFENGGAFVAKTLSAGLLVLLAREVDGPSRPVDCLDGECGDVGLATAQMPKELVEGPFLWVLLTVNDPEVLFFGDRFLVGILDLGPKPARDDRYGKVAHIEGEVVEPAKENVGRNSPGV